MRLVVAADPFVAEESWEADVAAGLARSQAVLCGRRTPLEAVIGAAALQYPGPDGAVLRSQAGYLAEISAQFPQVRLRLLPPGNGIHAACGADGFTVAELCHEPPIGIVHAGGVDGGWWPESVAAHLAAFGRLREAALTPGKSIAALRRLGPVRSQWQSISTGAYCSKLVEGEEPSGRGGVDIYLSVADDGGHAGGLDSLEEWLRDDRRLSGRVHSDVPGPAEGQLGALTEALVVAVGSGGTLSVLAASLRGWLSQPRRSDVTVRVWDSSGRVVEVSADRVDAEAVLRQAYELASPEDGRAAP